MIVESMRILAGRGIRTLLPDLPGCNESLADISTQSLESWQLAIKNAALACGATHIGSLRGGTLIDHLPRLPVLRLAPVKGSSLLKTMLRTRILADKEVGKSTSNDDLIAASRFGSLELSGYVLDKTMLETLEKASPSGDPEIREVTLAELGGSPLWLRAEPQDDAAMSLAYAAAIDSWSASCVR